MSIVRMLSRAATVAGLACAPIAAHAGTFTTLYSFTGGADGAGPYDRLSLRANLIYGTLYSGGASSAGAIFSTNPTTGGDTVLYSFKGGADGANPQSHLTLEKNIFYGVTGVGGANNAGTVFSFNPKTKKETVIYSFTGGADGSGPIGGVVYDAGYLWGVTNSGGAGHGTFYKIELSTGAETTLHAFAGGSDGASPVGLPTKFGNVFYGTTVTGGPSNNGTIYTVNIKTGAETIAYSFTGGADGANPFSTLVNQRGYLFGTTYSGANGYGCLYYFNPKANRQSAIYSFSGGADGAYPISGVALVKGVLYGTAQQGGMGGFGVIYSFVPTTFVETTEYQFTGGADGAYPWGELSSLSDKVVLYGSTAGNNQSPYYGSVFSYTP